MWHKVSNRSLTFIKKGSFPGSVRGPPRQLTLAGRSTRLGSVVYSFSIDETFDNPTFISSSFVLSTTPNRLTNLSSDKDRT